MAQAGPAARPLGLSDTLARRAVATLVAALGHLLEQNDWARQRLAMHAGRRVLIGVDVRPLPGMPEAQLLAVIVEGGRLTPAEPSDPVPPAVTMLLQPSVDAVFDFFRGGSRALSRHLRMEGDVMLAGALGDIVRHLRWDPTEDLSRYTGDIAAERITGLARRAVGAVFDAGKRVESNAAHYLSVESGQLVDEASLEMLAAQIDALERRVDALSGRVRSPGQPPGPWSG